MQQENEDHHKEKFELGSVAVVNADAQAAAQEPTKPFSKIGNLALSKEEKMMEPGEQLVTVVRRHPIGLVGIYAEMLSGILLVVGMVLTAILGFLVSASGQTKGLIAALGLFIIAFLTMILIIAVYVYRKCRLIVTDKSVVQVIQRSFLNRKISRLSMSNVEDVNVEQKGILAMLFNYGTLTIQTAGEVDNFVFKLCPTPDAYANRILEARQAFARAYARD